MNYQDAHERFYDDIRVAALSQRVPGMDYDDVVSEMTTCLWKALKSWDEKKGPLGSYWWSMWLNRRSDLTEAANRQKRPKHVLTDQISAPSYTMARWPDPPRGSGPTEEMVWNLLASGEQVKDVITLAGLSRRAYYALINEWRTEEVRNFLR